MVERRPGLGGFFGFSSRKEKAPTREEEIYFQASALYRAWHLAEGRNRDIIDFDLQEEDQRIRQERQISEEVLAGRPNRATRNAIVTVLNAQLERFTRHQPVQSEKHNWDFATQQTKASLWFAKRLRGDTLDPFEYIENTTGLKPEYIPEQTLKDQKDTTLELLKALGVVEPSEATMLGLRQDLQINPEKAQEELITYTEQAIREIKSFLREDFKVDCDFEAVNLNEYYWVWIASRKGSSGFTLRQNFGGGKIWTPGKALEMGWHEGGQHASRMAKRQEQIRNDKLNDFFGLTTVHGPEAVVEEGLAQTLTYFIPGAYETLTPEGKFQVNATILRNMAYSNAHLMVNSPNGYDINDVIEYIREFVPWEARSDIEQQVEWRTKRPLHQVYLWTYGIGAMRHLEYARQLSDQGKRAYLQNIFPKPYTPSQEQDLVDSLLQRPENTRFTNRNNPPPISPGPIQVAG